MVDAETYMTLLNILIYIRFYKLIIDQQRQLEKSVKSRHTQEELVKIQGALVKVQEELVHIKEKLAIFLDALEEKSCLESSVRASFRNAIINFLSGLNVSTETLVYYEAALADALSCHSSFSTIQEKASCDDVTALSALDILFLLRLEITNTLYGYKPDSQFFSHGELEDLYSIAFEGILRRVDSVKSVHDDDKTRFKAYVLLIQANILLLYFNLKSHIENGLQLIKNILEVIECSKHLFSSIISQGKSLILDGTDKEGMPAEMDVMCFEKLEFGLLETKYRVMLMLRNEPIFLWEQSAAILKEIDFSKEITPNSKESNILFRAKRMICCYINIVGDDKTNDSRIMTVLESNASFCEKINISEYYSAEDITISDFVFGGIGKILSDYTVSERCKLK